MIWKDLTFEELEKVDKKTTVILPIGSIEQHGSHLPLKTDAFIAEYFSKKLSERCFKNVLILPPVSVCCSEHHMDFCGSLTVSHMTLFHYINDLLESVIKHNFKNLIIFNAHGGNVSIGETIVENFGLKHKDCNICFVTWWNIAREKLLKLNEAGPFGVGHAGEFETSILKHISDELVREDKIQDGNVNRLAEWADGDLIRPSKVLLQRTMKEITKNGVFGTPSKASKNKGKEIIEIVLEEFEKIALEIQELKR